jgi:hypothetical protein
LELSNVQFLPFALKQENFNPIWSYITLEITTDEQRGIKASVQNLALKSISKSNDLILTFDYNFHLEGLNGELKLNYEKTLYKNETQKLNFVVRG